MAEELSYADALTELDDILNELEAVDVDVDRLAERGVVPLNSLRYAVTVSVRPAFESMKLLRVFRQLTTTDDISAATFARYW